MKEPYLVGALLKSRTRISALTRFICSAPSVSNAALKNVTKSNFEPALAELRRLVKEADFVSIDLEMTGVTSAPWRESFEFDRSDIQYLKVKDSADKFAVVQFGESLGESSSFEFLCQASSLEFLAKYQFNFNACIYEGISYLSRSQEEEALRRLDLVHQNDSSYSSSIRGDSTHIQMVRMADILFTERMKRELGEWRTELLHNRNRGSNTSQNSNDMRKKFQTTFFQMRPAFVVNGCTCRQLRLIKLVTEKNFLDLFYVQVTDETSGLQHLIVYTESTTDKEILMREVRASQRKVAETKLKAAIGFRQVTDLLSEEKKLIVGHNCFLDIAHVYNKFVGSLPTSAEEFCSVVQVYFPYIVDTKMLLNADDTLFHIMKKGSTSLSKAFTLLCPQLAFSAPANGVVGKSRIKVEVQVDDQRFSNWNSGAKHEAGYDAFMTGCVFAQACCHLGIDFNNQVSPIDLRQNENLGIYINLLSLSWVNGDVINLKSGTSDTENLGSINHKKNKILFPNMVLLWGLTSKVTARDIRDCMHKAFGNDSVTSIYYLDETAAFVQFSKPKLVTDFLELKDTLDRENNPITVLHPLSRILGGCVHAASYEIYKDICSSPLAEMLFADQAEAVRLMKPAIG